MGIPGYVTNSIRMNNIVVLPDAYYVTGNYTNLILYT